MISSLDERAALVVIDLQNGVVGRSTGPHSADDVVSRTVELAAAFRARGLPVVLVRVSAAPDWSDFAPGRTETPRAAGALPEGWDQVVDALAGHPDDIVVTKRDVGAFHGTDLDLHLRRRGVTQIVLTGLSTTMGVESTARAGYDHGYHVVLVTDAMADSDADAHDYAVATVFPRIGETGTTAEVLELLEKSRRAGVRSRS
jgi:nicotinamidase-related amidase